MNLVLIFVLISIVCYSWWIATTKKTVTPLNKEKNGTK